MSFSVNISARAEADIDAALVWIRAQAPTTAQRWYDRLRAAMETLETMPERFSLAAEAVELQLELRELLFGKRRGTFRILFTIQGSTVHVLHVRRAARGPVIPGEI